MRGAVPGKARPVDGLQYLADQLSDAQMQSDPDWADCEFEEAKEHTYHFTEVPVSGVSARRA